MTAPLGPWVLATLIAVCAVAAFAVVLGAGRGTPDPPWDGEPLTDDEQTQLTALNDQFKEKP